MESAAKRKKLESYVDVCNDVGGYNQLTFEEKDGEDCLYTSLMQLPSLKGVCIINACWAQNVQKGQLSCPDNVNFVIWCFYEKRQLQNQF